MEDIVRRMFDSLEQWHGVRQVGIARDARRQRRRDEMSFFAKWSELFLDFETNGLGLCGSFVHALPWCSNGSRGDAPAEAVPQGPYEIPDEVGKSLSQGMESRLDMTETICPSWEDRRKPLVVPPEANDEIIDFRSPDVDHP